MIALSPPPPGTLLSPAVQPEDMAVQYADHFARPELFGLRPVTRPLVMRPPHPSHSYRRVAMQTAPPGHLVLQLYEGVIRFLEQALSGFAHDDPVAFNQTISNGVIRAQEIIRELDRSLNLEVGGELAVHLRRLYDYFDRRLTESNLRKETAGIHEVIQRVSALRDSWAGMLKGQGETVGAEPAGALSTSS